MKTKLRPRQYKPMEVLGSARGSNKSSESYANGSNGVQTYRGVSHKDEILSQRQDAIYNLRTKVEQFISQPEDSVDYSYERSVREAQRRAETRYEEQLQSLENEKIELIKRYFFHLFSLNLSLVELDRLIQDKNDISAKVHERSRISEVI